jgi:hypothetical protein
MFLLMGLVCNAQKLDSLEVTYNGISHVIRVDDQVHMGYGKNPYGTFQFVEHVTAPLPKEYGGRTATVKAIRYYKGKGYHEMRIKFQNDDNIYLVRLPKAIEIEEIIGFNEVRFKKQ